jgi:polysaccharide biosynthesis transport protein
MDAPAITRPPVRQDVARQSRVALQASPAREDDQSIELRAMLDPVLRRKWLVLTITLIAMAMGVLLALQLQDRYTASARVIFEPERLQIIDLDNVVVSPDVSATGLQNQIEILRSAVLLERVIDVLRLESTPEFNASLRRGPPPLLDRVASHLPLPERVRTYLIKFGILSPRAIEYATPEEAAEVLRASMLTALMDSMRLSPVPNSRVIEIGYHSTNARLAAAIVNAIGEQYIILQTEVKRDDIARASELLSTRAQDLENRLNSAEEALRLSQLELTMDSRYGAALIEQQLGVLNASLADAQLARSQLESQVERLSRALEDGTDLATVQEFRQSPVIGSLRTRETALLEEEVSLRAVVGEGNSALAQFEARLQEVRRNIEAEAHNIVAALTAELESGRALEAALQDDLRVLEEQAVEQSRAEVRIERLEREAEASRKIYEDFLARLQETREQANLQTPDARFLTRATVPQQADSASESRVVVMAGMGGLVVGIGVVFLLEMLNNTFRGPTELEAKTGLPVLAAVPRAGSRRRPKDLIAHLLKNPNSALAESVRNLRTSILFSNIDQPPKVIMFSSSLPGEGKTTTAILAAITSQQMGRSAIIVDCDLRRGTVASMFLRAEDRPGLFAVLEGASSIEGAVQEEPETGLHILAAELGSRGKGNPADILASRRFHRLIEQLRARYDIVILDTPPVLVVTDARIAAQLADTVVYLVRWEHTRQSAVLDGLKELTSLNARVAGVALSLVSEKHAAKYVDGGYYYHRKYKKYVSS